MQELSGSPPAAAAEANEVIHEIQLTQEANRPEWLCFFRERLRASSAQAKQQWGPQAPQTAPAWQA